MSAKLNSYAIGILMTATLATSSKILGGLEYFPGGSRSHGIKNAGLFHKEGQSFFQILSGFGTSVPTRVETEGLKWTFVNENDANILKLIEPSQKKHVFGMPLENLNKVFTFLTEKGITYVKPEQTPQNNNVTVDDTVESDDTEDDSVDETGDDEKITQVQDLTHDDAAPEAEAAEPEEVQAQQTIVWKEYELSDYTMLNEDYVIVHLSGIAFGISRNEFFVLQGANTEWIRFSRPFKFYWGRAETRACSVNLPLGIHDGHKAVAFTVSGKEAKELEQKVLQRVGITPTMVKPGTFDELFFYNSI